MGKVITRKGYNFDICTVFRNSFPDIETLKTAGTCVIFKIFFLNLCFATFRKNIRINRRIMHPETMPRRALLSKMVLSTSALFDGDEVTCAIDAPCLAASLPLFIDDVE